MRLRHFALLALMSCLLLVSSDSFAHGVDDKTRAFLMANEGVALLPFMYIGAKHMVTGYDHLLFLVGVLFFLYRTKDVLTYVSLFTLGHSITLMLGVLSGVRVDAYLIDALIGLSVVYKGFDNIGGPKQFFGVEPNAKVAVLLFGLVHGLGLATKIQEFEIHENGFLANLVAFNVGVELGQVFALTFVLILLSFWRRHASFLKFSLITNTLLMSAGLVLCLHQLAGYLMST